MHNQAENTSAKKFYLTGNRLLLLLILLALLRAAFCAGLYWRAVEVDPQEPLVVVGQWMMVPDAAAYHETAISLTKVWAGKASRLDTGLTAEYMGYPVMLAALYSLIDPHPLVPILLNVLCFFLLSLIAIGTCRRIRAGPGEALFIALLTLIWPPSFSYTSGTLRDPLTTLALAGFLFVLLNLIQAKRPRQAWFAPVLLAVVGWVCFQLRHDTVILCPMLTILAAFFAVVSAIRQRRLWLAGVSLLCLVSVYLAAWAYTAIPLSRLYEPHQANKAAETRQAPRFMPVAYTFSSAQEKTALPKPLSLSAQDAEQKAARQEDQPGGSNFLTDKALDFWRWIFNKRWLYTATGSASIAPDGARIVTDFPSFLGISLSAAGRILFFPSPWERWPASGGTMINLAVTTQSVLWWLVVPGLLWGLITLPKRGGLGVSSLYYCLFGAGVLLALVVTNLGTLYRLRDMVILPLLPVISLRPYAAIWGWISRRGTQPN
ncbi:MAG: hypothetical protein K9K66_05455 [Desulfarculaceae bacterium]|nr:hypothetical protein [Desulfarculaceae bacterium]MCF8072919.1 hypothetical protein [Desulfarculaceae bacterium]MCF8101087.1 hypothetical protein [Desulfarculaceae bacterium]MCF8115526.1 hypothetical protein [Desulfarculaceae bacterium]